MSTCDIDAHGKLREILDRLENVQQRGDSYTARCPAHDDNRNSLSVSPGDSGGVVLHCHAGCAPQDVVQAVGLTMLALMPPRRPTNDRGRIVAEYPYHDEQGTLLYQSVRMEPKDFRQRTPLPDGKWLWKLNGVQRVLYRLPELLTADPSQAVYIVEGEKDVDRLRGLGLVATCNAGGAGKWKKAYSDDLAGRHVVILPDNDDAGRQHAAKVAASLQGKAASVKVVDLPDLPPKGDVSDWLDAGGTIDELRPLAESSVDWKPGEHKPQDFVANVNDTLPEVALPGGGIRIIDAASRFGELLAATGQFYLRGGAVMRLESDENGEPKLSPVRPSAFCSDVERVSRPVKWTKGEEAELVPANCTEAMARLILDSVALKESLPKLTLLTRCPVLIEREGELVTVSDGFDAASGILASGRPVESVPLPEAVKLLQGMLDDFNFATAADRARALAATITPALVFGGLLGGRAPVDLSEADQSQTGKGYRNKLTAAIYNARQRTVTQRSVGGVGSVQETFDAALVAGANMVTFDNFRGALNLPALESFLTEDSYSARVPYGSPIEIDPRRIAVALTSNKAEVTIDFANRSSCVRLVKQSDGYAFRAFPEGDLLDHVIASQPKYLGAVFSVVKEWHRRGKPLLGTVRHDFRRWARVLGCIVQEILGAGDMLAGHRAAQARIASPGLNWLRDVVLAVVRAGKAGEWLRSSNLLQIAIDGGVDTPGINSSVDTDDETEFLKATRAIGRKLGKLFAEGDEISVDGFRVQRRKALDQDHRQKTEICVFFENPQSPPMDPQSKHRNPQTPQYEKHSLRKPTESAYIECKSIGGIGGHWGAAAIEEGEV